MVYNHSYNAFCMLGGKAKFRINFEAAKTENSQLCFEGGPRHKTTEDRGLHIK